MRQLRVSIAAIVTVLICLGVIMIYSSSGVYASENLGDRTYFLKRHLVFLFIGSVITFFIMIFDYRILQRYSKWLLLLAFGMLVLVLIPGIGSSSFGARRWFKLGPMSFQPSEFTKLAIMVYAADFLSRKQGKITNFLEGFLPLLIIMGSTCLLIIKQPDLGSSVLIASIILILLYVAGTRLIYIGGLVLSAVPLLVYLVVSEPYRMRRIIAFLDPWQDSQGAGFQLSQSQIALGSGGVFGVGLGQSMQKLFYLPAAHTDFILSIIGEELGLVGTILTVLLFAAFIWQGARIVKRTANPFGYYLALGIVALIGLQAVVNIGVSIGAFPTKGLPLPFISYGGSALVFNMMGVGLLLNMSRTEDI
ncbi:MAG: putative lipid II flippase FtsW [Candidatus Omnitrophica bacterium]|nr:putative lipid II flippase FtsW [Candidatus Omnitrophota bacterium]